MNSNDTQHENRPKENTPSRTPRKKRTFVPQYRYIGFAQHIYHANERALCEAFEEACESGASQITLTIDVPHFARNRKAVQVHLTAPLPVYARFGVVELGEYGYSARIHVSASWNEIVTKAQEHYPKVGRAWRLQVTGLNAAGQWADDVELLTVKDWPPGGNTEEPPTTATARKR